MAIMIDSMVTIATIVFLCCGLQVSAAQVSKRTGEITPVDVNSQEVRDAASFAVQEANRQSNSPFEYTLLNVIYGTKQVVAGIRYELNMNLGNPTCKSGMEGCPLPANNMACRATVIHRAWMQPAYQLIGHMSCSQELVVSKRLPGGVEPADVNGLEVTDAARFAVEENNRRSNSIYSYSLQSVISATQQVVAGMRYELTLTIGNPTCKNGAGNCSPPNSQTKTCTVSVVHQAWMDPEYTLVGQMTCTPGHQISKRRVVKTGGIEPADVTSEEVRSAAEFAVMRYNMQSNSIFRYSLLTITSATQQVVAGVRYEISMTLGNAVCKNGSSDCPEPVDAMKSCTASVVSQPWMITAPYQLINVTCQ